MITVYISNESLNIASGSAGGKVTLKEYHSVPLPDGCIINGVITDETALSELIEKSWAKYKLPRKNVNLILNNANISVKMITLPRLKPKQLHKIMLDNFSEFDDIDKRTADFRILNHPAAGEPYQALACAVPDDTLKTYVDIFESKKIVLSSIDIGLNAQIELIKKIAQLKESTFVLCILDKNSAALSLYLNGVYRFSNSSRIINERGTPECTDEITSALSSIIQFNRAQKNGFDIKTIYVCGVGEGETTLLSSIGLSLGVEVKLFPNFAEYVSPINPKPRAADCFYSLAGLAE